MEVKKALLYYNKKYDYILEVYSIEIDRLDNLNVKAYIPDKGDEYNCLFLPDVFHDKFVFVGIL